MELTQNQIRWKYNCLDVSYTLEIAKILEKQIAKAPEKMQEFWKFQQYELLPALTKVMERGVRVDLEKKQELLKTFELISKDIELKLNNIIGEEFNPRSPAQIKKLFKELLNIKPIVDKKTYRETFNSQAMLDYREEYPLYSTLITLLLEYRTINIFVRTFLSSDVDYDGRMRSSYNVAGTKTYRLSSRKNAFGSGMNLQNIPSKGKIDLRYSLESMETEEDTDETAEINFLSEVEGTVELPNCKELFIPDDGYTFFDIDYSGADAMVVAWDSDCVWLKNFFRTQKIKLYQYIGQEYLQRELSKDEPWYGKFKRFIHLSNYGGGYEKAGKAVGIPAKESKRLQNFYFKYCPELPDWHKRIRSDVRTKGYIENIFGARFFFLDKNDKTLFNKAYATIPQSTIGIMVNKGLVNIDKCEKNIQVLMQVHDSLAGQFLSTDLKAPERIKKHMSIELPYKEPLIIPAEIAISTKSYGACK